jgi:hypothetical protein
MVGTLSGTAPPRSLADAKQINGVTREAREGSLVPLCLDDIEFGVHLPSSDLLRLSTGLEKTPGSGLGQILEWQATAFKQDDEAGDRWTWCRELPFMQSGSYYSGLNQNAVLQLNFHCYVETFPSPGNDLMAITSPSPPLDMCALKCVSMIQSSQVAGYHVSENGIGDFFRKAFHALKDGFNKIVKPTLEGLQFIPRPVGRGAKSIDNVLTTGMQTVESVEALFRRKKNKKRNGRRNGGRKS